MNTSFSDKGIGLGMHLRDDYGLFLKAKIIKTYAKLNVAEGDAYGLYHTVG